ncbi:MAG: hypothetical protein M1834_000652 [Cirrosporium novae-zelandiae]|nr:MAG: hypothetical protein M1834_000652 [Cirrosporium novae-zelandiae]
MTNFSTEHENVTISINKNPEWNSNPMFQMPAWGEPLLVISILLSGLIITRRRGYKIFHNGKGYYNSFLDSEDSYDSSDNLLYDPDSEDDGQDSIAAAKRFPKRRSCCGAIFYTPNTSRFANKTHSRFLQKFPFLIEMFYWVMSYLFYRLTKVISQIIFARIGIWQVSEQHGLTLLWIEHESWLRFFFPLKEISVQQWFMNGHQDALTFLNRAYALVHIPGTVSFIAWFYYVAPNHSVFAVARRTLTLTSWFAFITFSFYPCMPPRLLPKEYGFLDSVRHDNAESIWMSGKYVNSLAAMPSMHFGWSFIIGCSILHYSGLFRRTLVKGEVRKSLPWKIFYLLLAIAYPTLVLTAIIATANHYWLDAVVAVFVVIASFICNKIFFVLLPIEDFLFWILRAEKPIPSTGERFHQRGGNP